MFSRQLIYEAQPVLFMTQAERMAAFVALGLQLQHLTDDELALLSRKAAAGNTWFDQRNVTAAIGSIAAMLDEAALTSWLDNYQAEKGEAKKVGVVMAGNVPAVGFHDLLCILISGHHAYAKLSSDDTFLPTWLTGQLIAIEPRFAGRIHLVPMLKGMDAVIATGSDNTSRYFEYYFRNIPHIIRKNRSSCAVLTGHETGQEMAALGDDIFRYYGLGCRNVAKLFVPEEYNFSPLLNALEPWSQALLNHKYTNNYDYNKSIYLVNRQHHLDTGYLLLTQSTALVSPISVLYFEYYSSPGQLKEKLAAHADKLQCVVSAGGVMPGTAAIGRAQEPQVWEYADKIDTIAFLKLLE